MRVGRSRFWDDKWSKINHRPRTNVRPARLWSACSWRNVSEGKSIQHMVYRNAILENNEQQLKRWSFKCHLPALYNILILSSAESISHRFHFVWTGTIRRLWRSPGSNCFCSRVKRQSLTHICDLVPGSQEPFGAGGVCPMPPHRSCSRLTALEVASRLPTPLLWRGGMSLGTSERQYRGICQDTRPGVLYLSVQWCITIFNTITTFVVPALVWNRRL